MVEKSFFIYTVMSKIKIKGDNNQVYNNIKHSRINSDEITTNNNSTWTWVGLVSLVVAVLGLFIKMIVSWSSIVQFFK